MGEREKDVRRLLLKFPRDLVFIVIYELFETLFLEILEREKILDVASTTCGWTPLFQAFWSARERERSASLRSFFYSVI